jgi:hypothetical protein
MLLFTAANEIDVRLKSDIYTKLTLARKFIEQYKQSNKAEQNAKGT